MRSIFLVTILSVWKSAGGSSGGVCRGVVNNSWNESSSWKFWLKWPHCLSYCTLIETRVKKEGEMREENVSAHFLVSPTFQNVQYFSLKLKNWDRSKCATKSIYIGVYWWLLTISPSRILANFTFEKVVSQQNARKDEDLPPSWNPAEFSRTQSATSRHQSYKKDKKKNRHHHLHC